MNNPYNSKFDAVLQKCMDSGIEDYGDITEFTSSVVFKNGFKMTFWNSNFPYAWLNDTTIKRNKTEFIFHNLRPRRITMYRFHKQITKWILAKVSE